MDDVRATQRERFPAATWWHGDPCPVGTLVDLGGRPGTVVGVFMRAPNDGWWIVEDPAVSETAPGSWIFTPGGTGCHPMRLEYPPALRPWR